MVVKCRLSLSRSNFQALVTQHGYGLFGLFDFPLGYPKLQKYYFYNDTIIDNIKPKLELIELFKKPGAHMQCIQHKNACIWSVNNAWCCYSIAQTFTTSSLPSANKSLQSNFIRHG